MSKKLKVCNLYCGIGGNRKLWEDVDVTAVELNPKIAAIYQDFFPDDTVIVGDAHQYLLEHFKEFDFIWSSPPCPTHSRINTFAMGTQNPYQFPDMKLYEEIVFLKHWSKGKYCIENVISYYKPLLYPYEIGSHYYWTNFHIGKRGKICREHHSGVKRLQELKGFDLSKYKGIDKVKTLRNCVESEMGLHILNESKRNIYPELFKKGV